MLGNRFAKGDTLLRVFDGVVEGGLRDTYRTSGDVDASHFQAVHGVLEPFAFDSTKQVSSRSSHLLEDKLCCVDTFVAQFLKGTTYAQAGRSLFDDEDTHTFIWWVRVLIGACQYSKNTGGCAICYPELSTV